MKKARCAVVCGLAALLSLVAIFSLSNTNGTRANGPASYNPYLGFLELAIGLLCLLALFGAAIVLLLALVRRVWPKL